ncbi:hypothetical protein C0W54_20250 [Photobacterium kishitanii]|uniref:hypothetical protein n=1 Tax=Photobacterium kishitanii TaxID=318456 RepID=UPI000D16858A|nr:hypothetical protein [Photobacterium kishitanii]PSW59471.1 hypothetical protein C0W54_20250 [Photobacterium kishitanii]
MTNEVNNPQSVAYVCTSDEGFQAIVFGYNEADAINAAALFLDCENDEIEDVERKEVFDQYRDVGIPKDVPILVLNWEDDD